MPGDGGDGRARQVGLNESVFRDVNERVKELADEFSLRDAALDLVCECGNPPCTERVRVPRSRYERLRADPQLFAIVEGHELPDVEDVVESQPGYVVVRKLPGEPARIAEATDPRSD